MFTMPKLDQSGRQFQINSYTGFDLLLGFLPTDWQAKRLGRRVLRGLNTTVAHPGEIKFTLPTGEVYEILDNSGATRAYKR